MDKVTVAIASDHGGYEQKKQLVSWMLKNNINIHDLGPYSDQAVDYPDYAALVAHEVSSGMADKGVLVCGTGVGMAMAANKFPGIRAANVTAVQFAELARGHNDANVITLSGRFVDVETNRDILSVFLSTAFEGGRHCGRVDKISAVEQTVKEGGFIRAEGAQPKLERKATV